MREKLDKLSQLMYQDNQHLNDVLQQLFPNISVEEENNHLMALTKVYHNYKREYAKPLSIILEEESMSKFFADSVFMIRFSYFCAGLCSTEGIVHLL